jgi:hypothetical protein
MLENHFVARLDLENLLKREQTVIDKIVKRSYYRKEDDYVQIPCEVFTSQQRKAKKDLIDRGIIDFNHKKNYSTIIGRSKSYRINKAYLDKIVFRVVKQEPYLQNQIFSNDMMHSWILDCFGGISLDIDPTPNLQRLYLIGNSKLWIKRKDAQSRIYSSITNLNRKFRDHLLLDGQKLVKLDIKSCQPYILAKLSKDKYMMDLCTCKSKDFYSYMGNVLGIEDRDKAKKVVIGALFDREDRIYRRDVQNALQDHFPVAYAYLSKIKKNGYNQLAIKLEQEEVLYMEKVWAILAKEKVRFLTIHDCLLVHKENVKHVEVVMKGVLKKNPPRIKRD